MNCLQNGFRHTKLISVWSSVVCSSDVAIPAYQDYIARAQVSEAVSLLGSGKTPMAEFYASQGTWPTAASDVMGNTQGKYTTSISIGGSSSAAPGSITLIGTMRASNVNAN